MWRFLASTTTGPGIQRGFCCIPCSCDLTKMKLGRQPSTTLPDSTAPLPPCETPAFGGLLLYPGLVTYLLAAFINHLWEAGNTQGHGQLRQLRTVRLLQGSRAFGPLLTCVRGSKGQLNGKNISSGNLSQRDKTQDWNSMTLRMRQHSAVNDHSITLLLATLHFSINQQAFSLGKRCSFREAVPECRSYHIEGETDKQPTFQVLNRFLHVFLII